MMRKLRKLADRTGWTVEDLIHEGFLEFVAGHEAEKQLETKIIRFEMAYACSLQSESQINAQPTKCDRSRRKCRGKIFA
jgi:hypothetical protein